MSRKYRLFDNDKLVGVFSSREIKLKLGTDNNIVPTYAANGLLYKMRYRIERETKEEEALEAEQAKMAAAEKIKQEREKLPVSIWTDYIRFSREFLKGAPHGQCNEARERAAE